MRKVIWGKYAAQWFSKSLIDYKQNLLKDQAYISSLKWTNNKINLELKVIDLFVSCIIDTVFSST